MAGSKAVLVGLHEKSASIVLPLLLDDGVSANQISESGARVKYPGWLCIAWFCRLDHLFFISKQWLMRIMDSYFYI